MDILGFSEFIKACDSYLERSGWEKIAPGKWKAPSLLRYYGGNAYPQWNAVVLQYQEDCGKLR